MWVASSNQLKTLREKLRFPMEGKILPQNCNTEILMEFSSLLDFSMDLDSRLQPQFLSEFPAGKADSPHNHVSYFLKINLLYGYTDTPLVLFSWRIMTDTELFQGGILLL